MKMDQLIQPVTAYVQAYLEKDASGHDWWHIHRVRNTAVYIAKQEKEDVQLAELVALLHDVGDHKLHGGKSQATQLIQDLLLPLGVSTSMIEEVTSTVEGISFKGAGVPDTPLSKVGQVVQDADRLDAIGAIGIARAFAFGGNRNRALYDPEDAPQMHQTFEAYKSDKGHTINHFYEKLLLLKDRLHTKTAKALATKRHAFMEQYLEHFFDEWNIGESL